MPEPNTDVIKTVGTHLITATLAALVTFFIAIGSYREKIDALTLAGAKTQSAVEQLTANMGELRLQMVEIKTEMRLNRRSEP